MISIHALTKRATRIHRKVICQLLISIHALTKRATSRLFSILNIFSNFNPRSHEESDVKFFKFDNVKLSISIHALTKRATINACNISDCFKISIHALTKRATKENHEHKYVCFNFNPRSHEESDKTQQVKGFSYKNFNPRSHEESDQRLSFLLSKLKISIHALTKRATITAIPTIHFLVISIHALTKRATKESTDNNDDKVFQSTLSRRERQVIPNFPTQLKKISIHALTKRATKESTDNNDDKVFQSTLSRRERHR